MSKTFGELVEWGSRRKGWSDYQLSAAIGLLPGDRPFNPTQIRRLRTGERQHLSRELVERLIEVLGLDPEEAWHAAGLWPPDLDLEGYRRFRQRALLGADRSSLTHRLGKPQGHVKAMGQLIPFPTRPAVTLDLARVA